MSPKEMKIFESEIFNDLIPKLRKHTNYSVDYTTFTSMHGLKLTLITGLAASIYFRWTDFNPTLIVHLSPPAKSQINPIDLSNPDFFEEILDIFKKWAP